MFRPYNFKSLLAWTVGSLAGNQAYYGTKIKQARDKENTSPLTAQLAREYCLYQESGGALGLEEWLEHRLSPDQARIDAGAQVEARRAEIEVDAQKEVCRTHLGEFDPNLAREVIGSLSILEQKIERIELAVQKGKISKSVMEDVFVIFRHSIKRDEDGEFSAIENLQQTGFYKKYFNTAMWIKLCHEGEPDLLKNYRTLLDRFWECSEKAIEGLQPDLWDAVVNEFNQKNSKTPLGIKMATWEFMEVPPNTKMY
jgi:hypothetical protein